MSQSDMEALTVTLVHSSDLHVDDDVRPGRYNGLRGLRAVLATADSVGADIVLLAGDTFDNVRVGRAVLEQAASLLAAAAMPVVMLPGNHDPAMADCLYARAGVAGLRQVRVLGVTDGDAIDFARHELRICGRAHRDYADMTPLATRWPRQTPRQVVMAHGHYVPAADWKSQAHRAWKISDDDLANTDADYIALGHWDVATPVGDRRVPAYYSGSPDVAGTVNLIRLSSLGTEVAREPLVWPRGD